VLPFQAAVEGFCDPGFEPLRDAFRLNSAERGELGAAVCVIASNAVVADLYGGWADQEQGRRWQPDTLVNMFSVGKGLVATCAARLSAQGKLDLDAAVAAYWPEFAAAGKDAITVRQLLSHQAGLPPVRRRLRFGLGFQLTQPERPIGPGQAMFGHFGAGGSLGFADPENTIAFGYVMNQMGPRWQNPRTRALVDAVYESLAR
jgi:CubicO group peptidase (beta-lactamase class C family)